MLVAADHLELLEHLPPERALRQHAFDGNLDGTLRMRRQELLERLLLHVADRARVAVVDLVLELAARDADLLGVDNDEEVARVDVGRVDWLVLAAQPMRERRRQTAERFALGIDEVPIAPNGVRLGRDGFHVRSALAVAGARPAKEAEYYWPTPDGASRPPGDGGRALAAKPPAGTLI